LKCKNVFIAKHKASVPTPSTHNDTSSIEKPKEVCPLKNPKATDVRLCGHKINFICTILSTFLQ